MSLNNGASYPPVFQMTPPAARQETTQRYGATYSTEKHNFGKILTTFPVADNWTGHQHHGYCWAPTEMRSERQDWRLTTKCPWYRDMRAAGHSHEECVADIKLCDALDAQ